MTANVQYWDLQSIGEKSNVFYWLRLARETAEDWIARGITKPRNILPIDGEAARILRHIRRQACKADLICENQDCQVWKTVELNYEPGIYPLSSHKTLELDYEPGTNLCTSCKTQGIGLMKLSVALWGVKTTPPEKVGEPVVDAPDLRGWINGRAPVPPDRLHAAIVSAWEKGWLSTSQAVSSVSSTADLEAAGSVMRRIFKRQRRTGKLSSVEKIATEIEQERQQMDQDAGLSLQRNRYVPVVLKDLPPNVSKLQVLDQLRAKLLQNCSIEDPKNC
ncbi:hypothetical protein [Candidatus Ferrigenium straubiae]|jgi:hypothetical protein|uniref:hypothetical protein n=1 Tax=Candidatus Ferrigenium straubiae TaxID=2919506 RepID=UPI003F4AAEC9